MGVLALLLLLDSFLLFTDAASTPGRVCDANIVSGRKNNNQFSVPPPSCAPGNYNGINTYVQGTQLRITWTCTTSPVDLAIVQENAVNPLIRIARNLTEDHFDWNGYPPQPLSNGITFFFELFDPDSPSVALFASDYINITSTSPGSSSSSSTATATSTTATISSSTSSSTSTSSSLAVNDNSSSNTSTAIGAGVGGGVGGALLVAIIAVLLFRRHRRKSQRAVIDGNGSDSKQTYETPAMQYQDETSSQDVHSELPAYQRQKLYAHLQTQPSELSS